MRASPMANPPSNRPEFGGHKLETAAEDVASFGRLIGHLPHPARIPKNCELAESLLAVGEPTSFLTKSECLMINTPAYSTLFSCLYDESTPIGMIGRRCHYSVFRSVEGLDVVRSPLSLPEIHDFAVIWDEDHDVRIINVIERIYMAGLLSPVQFIGEHKGCLTVIVAARFYFWNDEESTQSYIRELESIVRTTVTEDFWSTEVGMFDRSPGSPHQTDLKHLIASTEHRSNTYVRNIDSLWSLGTRLANEFQPPVRT